MKKIYIIIGLIVCGFLYLRYEEYGMTSHDYYKYTNNILQLDKKEYKLNEKIKFTYRFMKKNIKDKKTKIIICDDKDEQYISLKQNTRLNYIYKKVYPPNLWEDINISEEKYTGFIFPCNNNQIEDDAYNVLSFELTFKKEKNDYFLTNGIQKIKLSNIPYYIIKPFLQESIVSSGDYQHCVEKFIFIKRKKEKLSIQISNYSPC